MFRLSSNDYKQERRAVQRQDEVEELVHTGPRLQKLGKNHPECLEERKRTGKTQVRLLNCQLPSGVELALMTNLPQEQYTQQEIGMLYLKRWGIEQKYHTLKNKIKLESVTGKATIYVYQDFLA